MSRAILVVASLLLLSAPSAADEPAFGPDVYAARRAKLYAQMEPGSAVVLFGIDRLDTDIIYFTGVDEAGAVFVGFKDTGREILFLPPFSKQYNVSSDERMYPGDKAVRATGIADIRDNTGLETSLPGMLEGVRTLYHRMLYYRDRFLKDYKSPLDVFLSQVSSRCPGVQIKPEMALFMKIQDVKEPREIDKIRRAVEVTGEAVIEAMRCTKPGLNEYHLEALFNFILRRSGTKTLFHIIGSGPNSVILHHRRHTRDLKDGDLVLMDVGAEVDHYGCDITRTFPASGRFTPEQRRIYEIVLEANKAAIAAAKPGIPFDDLEKIARKIIADAGYGEYYNHSLGHPINGGWGDGPLQPGMIRTIEPGIYLPDQGFGVRIEDDILITADGCLNMTAFVPKEIDDIERVMRERSPLAERLLAAGPDSGLEAGAKRDPR